MDFAEGQEALAFTLAFVIELDPVLVLHHAQDACFIDQTVPVAALLRELALIADADGMVAGHPRGIEGVGDVEPSIDVEAGLRVIVMER